MPGQPVEGKAEQDSSRQQEGQQNEDVHMTAEGAIIEPESTLRILKQDHHFMLKIPLKNLSKWRKAAALIPQNRRFPEIKKAV